MQSYSATVVDLGKGNEGQFGPTQEVEERYDEFVKYLARPQYSRKATGNWICVDGREDEQGAVDDGEHADGQIPGSLPITNTAGDMMDDTLADLRLSQRLAFNTKEALADGHQVILHGDDHKGKDGCAANAQMRFVLAKIAADADAIGHLAWAFCEATGLDRMVSKEDINKAISTAGVRAQDDAAWDVTPSEVIDVAIKNGAKYQVLKGSHQERAVAAILKGTYASQKFAQDHPSADGGRHEVFGLSAGDYVETTIADTVKRGGTERQGALKAMRGLLYSIGLCKKIGNQDLRVVVLRAV